jgi:hypothetical protein
VNALLWTSPGERIDAQYLSAVEEKSAKMPA